MSGTFTASLGSWRAAWDDPDHIAVEITRIKQDHGDLTGEIAIFTTERGLDEVLHVARLNLLSTRSRAELAKHLEGRTPGQQLPWVTMLEAACLYTVRQFREGEPSVILRDTPVVAGPRSLVGDLILADQPTLFFGDGGEGKSWIALAVAAAVESGRSDILGLTVHEQRHVLYADWELSADEHRERLARLCAPEMPELRYVRCEMPLAEEVERIAAIVRTNGIGLIVIDSVAAACDGPPEAAEVAMRFARAVRQLRAPVLMIAHTNRSGDESRPFGSTFWHNFARLTWLVKRSIDVADDRLVVGLYAKKANLTSRPKPLGLELLFDGDTVRVKRADLSDMTDLAERLPLRLRMMALLRQGPMSMTAMATELEEDLNTISHTVRRGIDKTFVRVPDPKGGYRVALLSAQEGRA